MLHKLSTPMDNICLDGCQPRLTVGKEPCLTELPATAAAQHLCCTVFQTPVLLAVRAVPGPGFLVSLHRGVATSWRCGLVGTRAMSNGALCGTCVDLSSAHTCLKVVWRVPPMGQRGMYPLVTPPPTNDDHNDEHEDDAF
jgi:hypothetical protein